MGAALTGLGFSLVYLARYRSPSSCSTRESVVLRWERAALIAGQETVELPFYLSILRLTPARSHNSLVTLTVQ